MTSLRRDEDLRVESERGLDTIDEDGRVSRVRDLSLVEGIARRRLADGVSSCRWRLFSTGLSYGLIDS